MKKIDKASVIQNGLSRKECAAFFALLEAAEEWRATMVSSNEPSGGYLTDDPNGNKHWSAVRNPNGRLVKAVDFANEIIGCVREWEV